MYREKLSCGYRRINVGKLSVGRGKKTKTTRRGIRESGDGIRNKEASESFNGSISSSVLINNLIETSGVLMQMKNRGTQLTQDSLYL